MDERRLREVEEHYHAARTLGGEERARFLESVCGSDEDMRAEVESLLAAEGAAGSFLGGRERQAQIDEASRAMTIAAGDTVGQYEIVELLGEGGAGQVYLARDTRLDRRVALKFLYAASPGTREWTRFVREARTVSALNHPNIITLHDIHEAGPWQFLAMEYVDGRTLREMLRQGRLDPDRVLEVGVQIAAALEAAHRAGVVHRDLKPENIMVRADGLVKVLDFGLARVYGRTVQDLSADTETGLLLGTPRYMSPEQARAEPAAEASDIFTLGVILYEMCAGVHPFPAAKSAELFAELLTRQPPRLAGVDGIPKELDEAIARALAKEPGGRWASVEEFGSRLKQIRGQLPALRRRKRRAPQWTLAARVGGGVAAAAALAAVLIWADAAARNAAPSPEITPVTATPGQKGFAAISPDGSRIAFSWVGEEAGARREQASERDIYVQVIGAGAPLRLTRTAEDDMLPVWSPDGREIAFIRRDGAHDSIFTVPALGGAERKICDSGTGVAWSPDGKRLAIATKPAEGAPSRIGLWTVDTGDLELLTNPQPASDSLPAFSPDGRRLAFVRVFAFATREVFVMNVDGSGQKQLTFDKRAVFGVTFTGNGEEVVFSSNRSAGESLWRISTDGGEPRRMIVGQTAFYPSVSHDGTKLTFTESYADTNIYLHPGPAFGRSRPRGIVLSSREDHSPHVSPDGRKVAFVSKRTGTEEIWTSNIDGSSPLQLTAMNGPATGSPRWSPDGTRIAFDSRRAGNGDVYIIEAAGGAPRRLTLEDTSEYVPAWSQDGAWIYFASNRGTGQENIWKMPAAGGEATPVTNSGGFEGFESADGRTFYYSKSRGFYGLWSVPADGGGMERPVAELARAGFWRAWCVTRGGVWYVTREDLPRQELRFFHFATRRTRTVTELEKDPPWLNSGLSVSPDDTVLVSAQLDQAVDDVMLIQNFR